MSSCPDDDTLAAIVTAWNAAAALATAVPGGLAAGRGAGVQPGTTATPRKEPYAQLACRQGPVPNQSMSGTGSGARPYIDHRLVTIQVRGPKAAVAAAVGPIRAAFEGQNLSVANATCFMGCLPTDRSGSLEEDPATRKGEDVWMGTVELHVITGRTTP